MVSHLYSLSIPMHTEVHCRSCTCLYYTTVAGRVPAVHYFTNSMMASIHYQVPAPAHTHLVSTHALTLSLVSVLGLKWNAQYNQYSGRFATVNSTPLYSAWHTTLDSAA